MSLVINFFTKKVSYSLAGVLLMIPVLWIARTPYFYFCYTPIMIGALAASGIFLDEKDIKLPSKLIRCIAFISGMLLTELIYWAVQIIFEDVSAKNSFLVLSIELLLGIAVFELFFALAIGIKFLKKVIAK